MAKRNKTSNNTTDDATVEAMVPESETASESEDYQPSLPESETASEQGVVEKPTVALDVEETVSDYPAIDIMISRFLDFNFASPEAIHGAQAFIDTLALELVRDESKSVMKHVMKGITSIGDELHLKNLTAPTINWKGDNASKEAYLALITVASAIQRQALKDISSLSVMKSCKGRFAPLGNRIVSIWFK